MYHYLYLQFLRGCTDNFKFHIFNEEISVPVPSTSTRKKKRKFIKVPDVSILYDYIDKNSKRMYKVMDNNKYIILNEEECDKKYPEELNVYKGIWKSCRFKQLCKEFSALLASKPVNGTKEQLQDWDDYVSLKDSELLNERPELFNPNVGNYTRCLVIYDYRDNKNNLFYKVLLDEKEYLVEEAKLSGFQKFIGNYHSHRKTKKFGELRQQIEELLRAEVVNYQKVHVLDHQIALI